MSNRQTLLQWKESKETGFFAGKGGGFSCVGSPFFGWISSLFFVFVGFARFWCVQRSSLKNETELRARRSKLVLQ